MRTEIPFEESRKLMLEILKDIDAFCRKEHINYSLGEGSLIGAVRHKGMIPWDDDMDILMLRKDYDKFLSTFKSSKYVIQQYDYGVNTWMHLFIKVINPKTIVKYNETGKEPYGLWVSILPIDNAPDDDEQLREMTNKIHRYSRFFTLRHHFSWSNNRRFVRNILVWMLHVLFLVFPKDYWHRKAERVLRSYNHLNTARRGQFAIWWHDPWVCSSSAFDEYIETAFEDEKLMIIKGYDEYLRCQYGDYMQLPPEENRVPKHEYTAYWK